MPQTNIFIYLQFYEKSFLGAPRSMSKSIYTWSLNTVPYFPPKCFYQCVVLPIGLRGQFTHILSKTISTFTNLESEKKFNYFLFCYEWVYF